MSAPRRATRAGRNLLVALLIGAVIIVAIVVAYVAGRSSGAPSAVPKSASVATADPTVTGGAGATDVAPTGCLGGSARNLSMLLAAQKSASHSPYGAVEVAASFARWAYRFPYPSAAEAREVGRRLVAPAATAAFKNVAGSYADTDDITGGQVKKGTSFYLSTTSGLWIVRQGMQADKVTIDLSAAYVVNDEVSPTKTAAVSTTLVWAAGEWQVLSEQQPDTSALSAGGTQFAAGC